MYNVHVYIVYTCMQSLSCFSYYLQSTCMYMYMKIHVPSMLAKGIKTNNKQAATMV